MEDKLVGFEPVFDCDSKLLILGSFPSVKSREQQFFYGNKQNRFWKVLNEYFDCCAATTEDKIQLLLSNNIALWDIVASCNIVGSSDSTIKDVIYADIKSLINNSKIATIFCNGKTSFSYTQKYFDSVELKRPKIVCLPSTSSANVTFNKEIWLNALKEEI